MTMQFSPEVSSAIYHSREEAMRLSCDHISPELLLLGLLYSSSSMTSEYISQMSLDRELIRQKLEEQVLSKTNGRISPDPQFDMPTNNILRLSVMEARKDNLTVIEERHVLLAMLNEGYQNGAREILNTQFNVDYKILHDTIMQNVDDSGDNYNIDDELDEEINITGEARIKTETKTRPSTKNPTPVLDKFSIDLTRLAAKSKLDPVVGRDKEVTRLTEILCRRKKNNPILIGEPGVGKSAIVEGLAQMIADHKTSPVLFSKRVVSLDLTGMVAGTKYRGQFEERMKKLIAEIEANPDIIVFIDEIHTMIGAGSAPNTMDAANILKPSLARGKFQCIGATTMAEYRNSIEKDGALERRFQKIIVSPSSYDETLQILHNIKARYEEHHHVTYSDEALEQCVKLTQRYITDRFFPDKAIDALDEAGSKVFLREMHIPDEIVMKKQELEEVRKKKNSAVRGQNFELAVVYRDKEEQLEKDLSEFNAKWEKGDTNERFPVEASDIANVVAMMSGVPVQQLSESENTRLAKMADYLKSRVIAQDHPIEKMVKAIQRNRLGLRAANRPIGTFMLLGPTGVGKTYLVKQLAEYMFGSKDAIIRVDMSEFTESFNTSRLTGAPPGYVGYEEGGQLTEKVRRNPYSIVLLDEIEKAHHNVFNLLLQVLDEGRLTDGNGRLVDFTNTIIIMTSNVGTRQLKDFGHGIGFSMSSNSADGNNDMARAIIQKSLNKQFAPEFLNRLDEILTFDQLSLESVKKIARLELEELHNRLGELGYKMELSDEAISFIAEKGYDVQFGARPLKRAIQTYIEDELCTCLLNISYPLDVSVDSTMEKTIRIDRNGDKLAISLSE